MNLRVRLAVGLLACTSPFALSQSGPAASDPAAKGAASSAEKLTCTVDRTPPSLGDNQIAAEDYKGAEATFRAALSATPQSSDLHLGLVRALIGEDRVPEAQAEATAMLRDKPKDVLAEVAAAEAAFRAADIDAATAHSRAALVDGPCEGRADGAIANILALNGYYAKMAVFLAQAHRLRPNDELLRRDWLASLPRQEHEAELSRYLDGPHALSKDDQRGFEKRLDMLRAHRPGECRISSKSASVVLPLQAVYGDRSYPVAFGLDVAFNNTKRRMQIDTGASGITLTANAARALKLQPEYTIKTGGVGDEGDRDSYLAHVASIRIGDVELSDCMIDVVSNSKLDVDGLIGMDVFNRWLVTLDYPGAKARLDPLPARPGTAPAPGEDTANDSGEQSGLKDRYVAPEMKDWGMIYRVGHNILLPSRFKAGGPEHFLIMDTGAGLTSLSPAMAKEAGKLHSSEMHFIGLSGQVKKVYETDRTPLIAANLMLPPEIYYAYDLTNISHDSGMEISGLLGLPTLQRLTIQIDYRDNLLKLKYDPKNDVIRF